MVDYYTQEIEPANEALKRLLGVIETGNIMGSEF